MSKLTDFLQSGGKSKPMGWESFFTQYAHNESPLEQALRLGGSVQNANQNRLPSPAAPTDPNIAPTAIPQLDAGAFSLPVGRGSWFNRPVDPASLQTYLKKMDEQEKGRALEQEQVRKFILTHAELAGESPEAWTLKGIQDYFKTIQKNKGNPIKNAKAKADLESVILRNEAARKKNLMANPFDVASSTTTTGGARAKTAADVLNKFGL